MTDEDINYIKEKIHKIPLKQIASNINCNYGTLRHLVKKLGLTIPHCSWTMEEEKILFQNFGICNKKQLKELLPNKTIKQIKYKCNNMKISKKLHKSAKRLVKYSQNNYFFSIPNILNSTYAGFAAADGNIQERTKNYKIFSFHINSKDKEYLDNFIKHIEYDGPYTYENYLCKDGSISEYIRVDINGCNIPEDLSKHWNITKQKTYTLQPPNITDDDLIKAFIVGFIDGDGSISIKKDTNNFLIISFPSASKAFLNWLKDTFDRWTPEYSNKQSILKTLDWHGWIYKITGKKAKRIYDILMCIDCPRLERKWRY